MAFGEALAAWPMQALTISTFFHSRSSRLMPGLRGKPAVMTMMSEPAVSA